MARVVVTSPLNADLTTSGKGRTRCQVSCQKARSFRGRGPSPNVDTLLVLAGGESRRFGRPKAFIEVAGRPMVRRVVDELAPLADELVVSVANAEMVDRLRPILPEAQFARDRNPGRGPIEGFAQGFEMARGDMVLVAPCDAPLIRAGLYRLLRESVRDHDAAVPRFDVLDPMRGVYRTSAVVRLLVTAQESIPSPSALVDRLATVFVGQDEIRTVDPDLSSFSDVNTREDLADILRRIRRTAK